MGSDRFNSEENQQLSLEQFVQTESAAQKPRYQFEKSDLDFKTTGLESLYFDASPVPPEKESSRFFAFSCGLHILAIIGMSMLTIPLIEKKVETITVEIESPKIVAPPIVVQKGSAPGGDIQPAKISVNDSKDVIAKPVKVAKIQKATKPAIKAVKAPKAIAKASRSVKAAAPAPKVAARSTVDRTQVFEAPHIPDAVPMAASIDDINADDLDDTALKNSGPGSFDSRDLDKNLEAVDRHHQKMADDEAAKMSAIADELAQAEDKEAENLKSAQAAENNRIAALNKSRRAGEMAAAAKMAGNNGHGSDHATRNQPGGSMGKAEGSPKGVVGGSPTGVPSNVRKLEDLRQMPGNPRPQYSEDERMRGDQGQAVFLAYITQSGTPTQFKMLKSTGLRNLDAKTLAALKQWKFYPGQEGWVELPFRWDLRGGPQERTTRLRRSAGL